ALVATAGDGVISVRDAATGRVVRRLAGHTEATRALAFTPDGRGLLTAGYDRTVRLWDFRDEPAAPRLRFRLAGPAHGAALSPDGRYLASFTADGVRAWDTATGRPLLELPGHAGGVQGVAFRPDTGR